MDERASTTFYVATNGNDAWTGRFHEPNAAKTDGPFATLTRAIEGARSLSVDAHRKVLIRAGKYYDVAVELDARDSGLTIEAMPGEIPILYGGLLVTGWQKDGDRFWAAALPGVAAREWDFRMLLVNDRFCPRARLPKEGSFQHLSECKSRWTPGPSDEAHRFLPKPTEEELTTMRYRSGDLGPWLDINNAEVTVYHSWDESTLGLKAHDLTTQTLTFATPATFPPGAFNVQDYVVCNTREGVQEPGQWYLDRVGGKVVYWPKRGEDMSEAAVVAPTTERIISINGTQEKPVRSVTLKGLALSVTTTPLESGGWAASRFDGAISATFAHDCRFLDLIVANVAGQGLTLRQCDRILVQGCETRTTGAGGIYHTDGQSGFIKGNRVYEVGALFPSAIGIRVVGRRSTQNEVSHNHVSDASYSGIEGGGTRNRIEYNHIHNVMQTLNDGAAIYTSVCQDVIVRGNFAHDIAEKSLSFAYYFDEQSENCILEDNLAANTRQPIHIHMSKNCVLRNNVFVDHNASVLSFRRSSQLTFESNIVYAVGKITLLNPNSVKTWKDNLFFSCSGEYHDLPACLIRVDSHWNRPRGD